MFKPKWFYCWPFQCVTSVAIRSVLVFLWPFWGVSPYLGWLLTIELKYTYTKVSLSLLSTWFIIDQRNQIALLYVIQVMVIYNRAILVAVTLVLSVNLGRDIGKQSRPRHLIRVCTLFFNYRKLRVKWNSFKSPLRTIFQHFPRLHSETIDPPVLLVLWFFYAYLWSRSRTRVFWGFFNYHGQR